MKTHERKGYTSLTSILHRVFRCLFLLPLMLLSVIYCIYAARTISENVRKDIDGFTENSLTISNLNMNMISSLYYKIISNPIINPTLYRGTNAYQEYATTTGYNISSNLKNTVFFDDSWNTKLISFAALYKGGAVFYANQIETDEVLGEDGQPSTFGVYIQEKVPQWVAGHMENGAGYYGKVELSILERPLLYYVRQFYSITNGKSLGWVILGIDSDKLSNAYQSIGKYNDALGILYDRRTGLILGSSDTGLVGAGLDAVSVSGNKLQDVLDNPQYIVRRARDTALGYDSVIIIPRASLYSQVYGLVILSLLIITATSVVYFVILYSMKKRYYRYVSGIYQTFQNISNERYELAIPESRIRELADLRLHIAELSEKLEDLITRDYNNRLLLKEAELKALQNQINPHFLFNVLLCINWNAKKNRDEETSEMLTALSEYLHGNIIRHDEQKVTLEEELQTVYYYLFLQKVRFQEKLAYDVILEEESLLKQKIPKLSLQPVVENAVVHGIEPKQGNGHIIIHIFRERDILHISVIDDGVGFEENTLADEESHVHHRIGIQNIRERIAMIYGDTYHVEWKSVPGKGTTVEYTFPVADE